MIHRSYETGFYTEDILDFRLLRRSVVADYPYQFLFMRLLVSPYQGKHGAVIAYDQYAFDKIPGVDFHEVGYLLNSAFFRGMDLFKLPVHHFRFLRMRFCKLYIS